MKKLALFAALLLSTNLLANENGLPVGHTGGFGEPTCAAAGCHRTEPLNTGNEARVTIDVGPYVPNAQQRVIVTVLSTAGNRWGFQLTARRASDNALPAGTFEAFNQFAAVRCPNGNFAPCPAGQPTYVTHTSVGTAPGGQPGFKQFAFDWTPPGEDVGEIIFAAAGLAADGDRGTNSDITAVTTTRSRFATANPPSINTGGVLNSASLLTEQPTIAPAQIISVFGRNLSAPDAAVEVGVSNFDELGLIPSSLGRLSVVFRVPGNPNTFLGRMIYVSDTQANLQAPDLPAGTTTVMVQPVINRQGGAAEVRGAEVEARVQARAPGLYTFGSTGVGSAAAVNGQSGRLVAPPSAGLAASSPAQAGDVILLFGSGFGTTNPPFEAGRLADAAASLTADVTVEIGGMMANVLYAGAAPNYAGLTQLNVRLPDLPPGEHAVVVRQDGTATQAGVTVAVQ